MVGKDGNGISLARLSIHGSRHTFGQTTEKRRSGYQSIGQDRQDTRHRLQSGEESQGQVDGRSKDGQGHRQATRTQDTHRVHRQTHHEGQTTHENVKVSF